MHLSSPSGPITVYLITPPDEAWQEPQVLPIAESAQPPRVCLRFAFFGFFSLPASLIVCLVCRGPRRAGFQSQAPRPLRGT